MANQNVVRTLTVKAVIEGADEATRKLQAFSDAHKNAGAAANDAANNTDASAKRVLSVAGQWDKFRQSTDAAYGAQEKFNKALALAGRAVSQGRDVNEVTGALEKYRQKLFGISNDNERMAKTTGLAAYQVSNLRSQMFDVFTSLQGGISPFTVLSQQGPQVYEALAGNTGFAGGLKAAGQSASALLGRFTPMIGALGGIATAAAAAGVAYSQFASNQQRLSLGLVGTSVTAGNVNRVAEQNYSITGGLSSQSIREMSVEFARTRKIGVETFGELSKFTKDYALVTGTDLPTATKTVAAAMSDLSKGALDLDGQIGGLDGATYDLVKSLEQAGDRTGAQRVAMAAWAKNIADAKQQLISFATAWDMLGAAASRGWEGVGRGVARGIFGGYDLNDQIKTARAVLENSQWRANNIPFNMFGLGDSDVRVAEEALRVLEKLAKARDDLAKKNDISNKTLEGSRALLAFSPTQADIEQLTKWQTAYREALGKPGMAQGTEEALKHVTDMLKAGGTEAFNLQKAARDAFAQAPLLSYERSLAQIEAKYRDLVVAAHGNQDVIAGLGRAKEVEKAAAALAALNNPIRDGNLSLNEQAANLKVQRDSFLLSADAAGAMSAKQSLINQYLRDGVTGWEKNSAAIDAYAKRAGEAAAANEKLQRTQQNIIGGMDELRSGTSGLLTGIFSDTRQGKSPLDGIQNALGRMTDQIFERTVSKPLTESLLGFAGKGGGGLFGDTVSKLFGDVSGITTPQAVVNAGTVVVNGGIGGAGGVGRILSSGNGVSISNDNVAAGSATNADVIEYIRGAAVMRGMDPTTALKVARSEGLNVFDPSKGLAAPGDYRNGTPMSWGPFQLFTGGGLGNVFKKRTGLDPSDPSTWREQVDFSLDEAKKSGWGAWYGAGRVGVGKWDGIGKGADAATESVSKLSDKIAELPTPTDAFTDSLGKVGEKLASVSTEGGGGGLFASIAKWFSGGSTTASANGNIMTEFGPVPLNRYARGGVARSPQFSIFGEGRMPEAYVPLPDGRSIPVTVQGGGVASAPRSADEFHFHDYGSVGVKTKTTEKPDGGRRVDVMIGEMVAQGMNSPQGRTAMRGYGVRQPPLQA